MRNYAFNRLSASESEVFKKFLVNMLYYGTAAQQHLKQTENLATDGLVEIIGETEIANCRTSDSAWDALTLTTDKEVINNNEDDIITWKSATLVFDKTITMRLYFEVPSEVVGTLDKHKFILLSGDEIPFSDAKYESTKEGIMTYYIDITGFTPTEYDDVVSVTLNDKDNNVVSDTVEYSVTSYISSKKNSASVEALVRALYDYGVSGKEYKAAIS